MHIVVWKINFCTFVIYLTPGNLSFEVDSISQSDLIPELWKPKTQTISIT